MEKAKGRWKKILLRIVVFLVLALAVFAITPIGQDVIRIARMAPNLQSAKITDTHLFTPQQSFGENCAAVPFRVAGEKPTSQLTEALAEAQAYSEEMQGVGLIVLRDGAVVHESYAADGASDQPVLSYSMHKSLLALAVGVAIEKEIIGSIDDPVSTFVDEWANDPRGEITLKQLLNMESGLELTGPTSFAGIRQLLGNDINAIVLDKPLTNQPGSAFEYNNANSQVIGIALDRALKKAGHPGYAGFLEQEIWCPAGNDEAALWYDSEGGSPRYYAGVFTALANWARIGELIRNDGESGERQIVSSEWIAAMRVPAPTNSNYGLHVWLNAPEDGKRRYSQSNPIAISHSAPYVAADVLFFDGFGGQRVYVVPSAGLTIARSGEVNLAYDDAIIVNLILGAIADEQAESGA